MRKVLTGIALLVQFWGFGARASNSFTALTIRQCNKNLCFELKSPKGFQSPLDLNLISFEQASLKVFDSRGQVLKFEEGGASGYFDNDLGALVLRGKRDFLLNVRTGEVTRI
jgi:hypothetical protein